MNYGLVALYVLVELFNGYTVIEWLRKDRPKSSVLLIPILLGAMAVLTFESWTTTAKTYAIVGVVLIHLILVVAVPYVGGAYRMDPAERIAWRARRK